MERLNISSGHLGMYVDRSEISGPGGRAIELNDMFKNEIARRIAFALYKGLQTHV